MTFPWGVCVCVGIQVQLWHTWLKRLLSQASCFTMTSSSVRPLAAPLSPAPSCSLSESSRPMKRCWCVKHLFYPLLWDCSPAEYRRHREASINLWPLVETYFPHTSSLVLSLTLCLHPTSPILESKGPFTHAGICSSKTTKSHWF